jgi:two-component system CheB/CheR fusion protein
MISSDAPDAASSGPARASLPAGIVAIGASAGGLPALQEFLAHAPGAAGMAWVVVQHLDPTRETVLTHLLQRDTLMPVREAADRQRVSPDTVYVIPPNATLTLVDGHLHVAVPAEPRGWRHPIDDMFESLARVMGARAAGVVLSGSGDDGTRGLRTLHEAGGFTAVQQPETAQFDAMPRNALRTGLVDLVAPPHTLAADVVKALQARAATRHTGQASVVPQPDPARSGPTPPAASAPDALQQLAKPLEAPQPSPGPGLQPLASASASAPAPAAGSQAGPAPEGEPRHDPQRLVAILRLLQSRGCHDFFLYKRSTLLRRIERRMGIHRITDMRAYAELLARDDAELDLLAKELLIGVTAFFRDTPVWHALKHEVLPGLLKAHGDGWHMRAWVAGCSTGEEAYSMAITFREVVEAHPGLANCSLQVFATDLSKDAIDRARRGVYPAAISGEVSAQRLKRFFTPLDGGWRIAKEVREMVVFAPHDLTVDPPFTRLDLLSCRNLLIYLTAPLQRRLLPLFHYSLRPDGVLLLGSSETIGRFDDLFETTDGRLRLYRRRQVARPVPVPDFSFRPLVLLPEPAPKEPALSPEEPTPPHSLQVLVDRFLMQQWAPPSVLVNDRGDILYINGRTGRYLEPAAGKANWNVHVMAREGLRAPLVAAMRQAASQRTPVEVHEVPLDSPNGPPAVDLSVQSMEEVSGLKGMLLIVFRDLQPTTPAGRPRRRTRSAVHQELEAELQRAREEAQSLREEMRASQEELQAANEELQSTNEELQSTNEELTSSKEEMQAMNDELQAVNAELQAKLDDLAIAQSDMRNLLNSTDIATLFLDKSLQVRRFTERARKVISLRDGDVGRPLSDLTTSLDYPAMEEDVRDMLRTLVVSEKQVRSREGRWYAVRIMPYRTQDDVIEGAVVTFVDISAAREAARDAGAGQGAGGA